MITAGEIRIGNLIYMELYKGQAFGPEILEDVVKEVVEVDPNVIVCIHDGAKHYFPIPLTPEILKTCGFEKFIETAYWVGYKKGKFILSQSLFSDSSKGMEKGKYCYGSDNTEWFIETLHQLQNLYSSLTGEELTLTELNKK